MSKLHPDRIDTLVALELDPADMDGPLLLIVRGMRFQRAVTPEYGDAEDDRAQYYYEEHTCPTNILDRVEVVIDGDDPDPHGLFRYLGEVDYDDELRERITEIDRQEHGEPCREEEDRLINLSADGVRSLFGDTLKREKP